ncbi:MAG TPA: hypothetical protein VED40_09045 [Azospirillaceae bacterium]|nr:hypothetical protein [Azospirillaceae bacterium]
MTASGGPKAPDPDGPAGEGKVPPGFAHDLGNLLTAIHGYATLLVEDLGDGMPREFAKRILQATEEARALAATLPRVPRRKGSRVLLVGAADAEARALEAASHEVARAPSGVEAASALAAAPGAWDAVLVVGEPAGLPALEARCRLSGMRLGRVGEAGPVAALAALTG